MPRTVVRGAEMRGLESRLTRQIAGGRGTVRVTRPLGPRSDVQRGLGVSGDLEREHDRSGRDAGTAVCPGRGAVFQAETGEPGGQPGRGAPAAVLSDVLGEGGVHRAGDVPGTRVDRLGFTG